MWASKAKKAMSSPPRVGYRCGSGESRPWEIPTGVPGQDGVGLLGERESAGREEDGKNRVPWNQGCPEACPRAPSQPSSLSRAHVGPEGSRDGHLGVSPNLIETLLWGHARTEG